MNFIRHLHTINAHRRMVIRHARKAGIFWQGLHHDLSKYSLAEFVPSVRYYAGGKRSPNEREREAQGYSLAWMHHKGRNKHHYEYWRDINMETHQYEPVKMPLRYLAEMFCDRVAASKIYQKKAYSPSHPLQYFLRGNAGKMMHPDTAAHLEYWLRMLDEKGEKETFATIKKEIKARKEY